MAREKLKTEALLVDLDGTIVDPADAFADATAAACSALNITHPRPNRLGWEIARSLQRDLPIDDLFDEPDIESLKDKFLTAFLQAFYEIAPHKTMLLPRVQKTLDELAGKYTLGLVTRRRVPKDAIERELTRLGISRFFETIITALDVAQPTPAPDALLKAAAELHVPIRSCVVVSDSGVDIQAGKRAGATTIAVLSGFFDERELREEAPDLIVEDISCLPALLQPI
jgi:phosphoglycolate phosphatase